MDDRAAILLKELLISEVSGVDAPAHEAPGWMLMKSIGGGDPAHARKTGFACVWGEEGSDVAFAVSHEDAPTIQICKRDGTSFEVRKDALDPARDDDGASAASSSALPASEAESLIDDLLTKHDGDRVMVVAELVDAANEIAKSHNRHEEQLRDSLGRFRRTQFRRAQGTVKSEHFRFF